MVVVVQVMGGVFSRLRHPNYTGELLLWAASTAAGALVAFTAPGATWSTVALGAQSLLGLVGIAFVLAMAATGLEKRQREDYGESEEYREWTQRTWSGLTLPAKKDSTPSASTTE